jgi:prolipoprotein diacylglyceryltransferase
MLEGEAVRAIGAACLATGTFIVLSSIGSLFRVGNGLPISHLPPSRLVSRGVYRWMRHPHYVGFNLAFVGCGLLVGSWGRALGAGLLLLGLWLLYAMVFEEPRLERRFGDDYANYRKSVGVIRGPSAGAWFRRLVVRLNAPLASLANRLVLFRTGPILWVTYGLFAASAAVLMGGGVAWFLIDQGRPGIETWRSVVVLTVMVPVFSRAAWFVIPGDKPRNAYYMLIRQVGFVSWGGYAAALATGLWIGTTQGISPLRMLDIVMMTGLFGSAVSRWGCLTYGCCIGKPAGWGLRWLEPDSWIHRLRPGPSEPRIPTQILSSLHAALAGLALFVLSFRPSSPGALAAIGGILYVLPRFGVEHLREEARFGRWQLTAGQFGCAVVFILSVALLLTFPGTPAVFWAGGPALAAWPWVLTSSSTAFGLVFIAYGLHWKKVGRW